MEKQYFASVVEKGDRIGRTIGYPTLNLHVSSIDQTIQKGVYKTHVQIHGKDYTGALWFGPRLVLHETKDVLEIYVFDFDEEIYTEEVFFTIEDFIRPVLNFPSLEAFRRQMDNDIVKIKNLS